MPNTVLTFALGMTGVASLWRSVARRLPNTYAIWWNISDCFAVLAILIILLINFAYVMKIIKFFPAVKAEFDNPGTFNTFAAAFLNFVLLASIFAPWSPLFSQAFWYFGALGCFSFALYAMGRWLEKPYTLADVSPPHLLSSVVALFLSALYGSVIVPAEVCWFLYSGAFLAYCILMTIHFLRMMQFGMYNPKIAPGLWILVAASSVASVTYVQLNGAYDGFARGCFMVSLFLCCLLLRLSRLILPLSSAGISWFPTSFPAAAFAQACLKYEAFVGTSLTRTLAFVAVGWATFWNVALLFLAAWSIKNGRFLPKDANVRAVADSSNSHSTKPL
eukprot:GILJ01008810.1.p1 GENE.GILJ01008810.1~~GILJ01008810.1.p1  ORF type:complete len:390 (+),score=33.60 GILJ01008810.1:173-1171(+)